MAQAKGSNGILKIGTETTFNTTSVSGFTRMDFISESLRSTRNLITSNTIRANRNPTKPVRGNIDVAGGVTFELGAYPADVWYYALGSKTTATSGSAYKHTFSVGSSIPSFSIEKGFTDISQYFLYTGCKVSKMAFSVKPEGFQEVTMDIVGATETVSAATIDAAHTTYNKVSFDGFSLVAASLLEGGVAIAECTGIDNLTIENGLDTGVYVIGGLGVRSALPEGTTKVTGTLKAMFQNTTLYNKAKNLTESSLQIVYRQGTGAGTYENEQLTIVIPELYFGQAAPVITGQNGVYVELPFEAFYDNASTYSTSMYVELLSSQASID